LEFFFVEIFPIIFLIIYSEEEPFLTEKLLPFIEPTSGCSERLLKEEPTENILL